jgi:putative endonuclease
MITLYVIKSLTKKFRYVGITNKLNKRLNQHIKGYNKSTSLYKPFNLIYTEELKSYKEAREREIFLKSGIRRRFLDSL